MELYTPEYALEEINAHKAEIMEKNELTEEMFNSIRFDIAIAIKFIPLEKYAPYIKKSLKFCPDPNDVDFFALAQMMKLPLWSNDSKLREQKLIQIISTKELLEKREIKNILS